MVHRSLELPEGFFAVELEIGARVENTARTVLRGLHKRAYRGLSFWREQVTLALVNFDVVGIDGCARSVAYFKCVSTWLSRTK